MLVMRNYTFEEEAHIKVNCFFLTLRGLKMSLQVECNMVSGFPEKPPCWLYSKNVNKGVKNSVSIDNHLKEQQPKKTEA